eukprot:2937838-Pyramimonas_sp.AAC.1
MAPGILHSRQASSSLQRDPPVPTKPRGGSQEATGMPGDSPSETANHTRSATIVPRCNVAGQLPTAWWRICTAVQQDKATAVA